MRRNLRPVAARVAIDMHKLLAPRRFCHLCHLFSSSDVDLPIGAQPSAQLYVPKMSNRGTRFARSLRIGTPLSYHQFMHFYSIPPDSSVRFIDCDVRWCAEDGER